MIKYLLAFLLISFTCVPTKTNRQLFEDFHTIYAKADFKAMDELLAENFVGLDESGKVSFQKADYIEYMAGWNQAFKTVWHVVIVEEDGSLIKSIEYDTDIWNDYFYGGIKKTKYIYSFSKDKIATVQIDTVAGAAQLQAAASKRFSKFYKWVAFNFPGKMKVIDKQDKESALETKIIFEKYLAANK